MIEELKNILLTEKKTISVAESLTGGNLQALLSSVNGSSKFFIGGITAYNIDVKDKFFKFNYESAKLCDCVSDDIALSMAKGITEIMESDYGIGTTGFAVPNESVDVPYAYICIFNKNTSKYKIIKIKNKSNLVRVDFQKLLSRASIYFLLENIGELNWKYNFLKIGT